MSQLEDILSGAIGKALGADEEGNKGKIISLLLPIIVSMLANGGLSKILDSMKKQGLSSQADSWAGDGPNEPITADQAVDVLGEDKIDDIAGKLGLPTDATAKLVAEALPQAVDQASPGGSTEPDAVDKMLESIGK
jgi:uncharacterized protein YidB (DUF937 family)